jgi:hypothetical protein
MIVSPPLGSLRYPAIPPATLPGLDMLAPLQFFGLQATPYRQRGAKDTPRRYEIAENGAGEETHAPARRAKSRQCVSPELSSGTRAAESHRRENGGWDMPVVPGRAAGFCVDDHCATVLLITCFRKYGRWLVESNAGCCIQTRGRF